MERDTDTLEDLKFVLRVIADIQQSSDTIEEAILDIQERYRTLEMYNIDVTNEEKEYLKSLEPKWEKLFIRSKHRNVGLTVVKEKFTEITQDQISDFGIKLKAFAEKFAHEGPGSVGEDLDTGVKKLKLFRDELTKLENDKQELTNAERLFNLPISSYAALTQVQKEMKALDDLYKLYEEQKKSRQEWSETLWRDLNVQILVEGIDNYIKSIKRMSRDVRAMPVAKTLEAKLKAFKEALPLMTDLKHEALRERHWKQLMKETGIEFDMNPETFTLANLFAMELHRFNENIQNIVTSASKELQIEKGVKEVLETWDKLKFDVIKYVKGTQERGYVIGAVDEVMQTLDDNIMSLQGMSASRYIGPFLNTVQSWEKSLSLISEVIEIWIVVQRKWMYLEGIFVGGDIRSQLPEEAKKFDVIDKLFKKVSFIFISKNFKIIFVEFCFYYIKKCFFLKFF